MVTIISVYCELVHKIGGFAPPIFVVSKVIDDLALRAAGPFSPPMHTNVTKWLDKSQYGGSCGSLTLPERGALGTFYHH